MLSFSQNTSMQVNVMLKKLPEEDFGPEIDIREYSILDNPSVPSEVNKCQLYPILNHDSHFLVFLLCL